MHLLSGLGEVETHWSRGHQAQLEEERRVLDTGERVGIYILNAETSNHLPRWVSTSVATRPVPVSRRLGGLS